MKSSRILFVVALALITVACTRDPKALVANGNKYFDRQKYKEASIMYRRALQKDHKNAEAWYKLGLVDLRTGQLGEASGALTRALQLDPANTDASSKLADLYFAASIFDAAHRQQNLTEVKTIAADLLRRNPRSFDGLRLSGYVALSENRVPDAVKYFDDANRLKPNQRGVVLALCQSLAAMNRRDEAEKLARDLIAREKTDADAYDFLGRLYVTENRWNDAENTLKEKVRNNPGVGAYQMQLARFYLATNKPEQLHDVIHRVTSDPKTYPDGWMLVGDFYQQNPGIPNHMDEALNAFAQGEKADPRNKTAYQKRRAAALIAANRVSEASTLLDETLKSDPNDPEAVVLRAAMDIQTGQKDKVLKAINALQPLVGKYQNVAATPMLHLNLGRAYAMKASFDYGDADPTRRQNDLDQARIQLEQAIQTFRGGKYLLAELLLADVQMQRGDYARVTQLADDILNTDPTNVRAHMYRAQALVGMHSPEKAREDLNRLLAKDPGMTDARYQLAMIDFGQSKYKDAEAGFAQVWRTGDQRGFMGLMEARLAQGQFASVLGDLQKRVDQEPKNPALRITLANAQVRAGKYQEAVASYQQALNDAPKANPSAKADLMLRLAATKRAAGDMDGALQTLMKAREVMPGNAQVMVEIALSYDLTGRKSQARDEYEKVLKVDPNNVTALNNLAFMKADEGVDLDRALTLAQRARQQRPDNLDIQDTLALVYLRKKLTDEGLRIMTDLVDKSPDRSTFHYHRALALVQKGDKQTAKKELSTALQHKPSGDEQGKIRDLMSRIG